ncbi:MAG: Bor/Iss family lipoprotein [Myxococcota bacterium]
MPRRHNGLFPIRLAALALAVALAGSGCHSIYLHNGGEVTEIEQVRTHHLFAFELVELSTVDLEERCEGRDWKTVRTEWPTGHVFLSLVTNPFWGPRSVQITCE